MKHYITLGQRVTIITEEIPAETDPEQIFRALNRIEDVDYDCLNLDHEWQKELRFELDAAKAPSMSVGDTITFEADSGELLGAVIVKPFGFQYIRPGEGLPEQNDGRHVIHHMPSR